jgi:hypothetical protein
VGLLVIPKIKLCPYPSKFNMISSCKRRDKAVAYSYVLSRQYRAVAYSYVLSRQYRAGAYSYVLSRQYRAGAADYMSLRLMHNGKVLYLLKPVLYQGKHGRKLAEHKSLAGSVPLNHAINLFPEGLIKTVDGILLHEHC